MKFLVVGGAGYIGSHFVRYALRSGHECVVVDDLSRGHRAFVPEHVTFFPVDIRERAALSNIIRDTRPDAVLHFAALALVGESVARPSLYYDVNVGGTLSVVEALRETSPTTPLVFSSTCAVFGSPKDVPVLETSALLPESPYGRTKLACEMLLQDAAAAHGMRVMALRYFNACGADPEGGIGEEHDPETHLIPNVLLSIRERRPFELFGTDYATPDGTCIRDYVHVTDLADAHVRAATLLSQVRPHEFSAVNLGTGRGYSNREVITACERITGCKVNVVVRPRRPGDATALYAAPTRARDVLGFSPRHSSLESIISTAWKWHTTRAEKRMLSPAQ